MTDYDRKYFARDEANGGVAIEKDSKYYELYVKLLKSKRIEVIEATDLNEFLLKLYEEYERSTRLTNETVPILLDANKDSIYKIFVDKNYNEMIDLEALGLLVQKTVALDEWIKAKPELL